MRNLLIISILVALFCPLTASHSEYEPGELLIQVQGDYRDASFIERSLQRLTADYEHYDLEIDRVLSRRLKIYLISFNDEIIAAGDLLSLIKKNPLIAEAQFNHQVSLRSTIPNDPLFGQQWALLNTGQSGGLEGADIDATLAWDITTGGMTANGREIVIAIIDDGFALTHTDLDFWKNQHEIPGNGMDDDGNGYIDDYDGWNAYNNNGNIPSASHGTHVAGIAGARGNNNIGVSGVNWGVKIMPIAGSSTNESVVIAAYGYVYEMRSLYNETNGALGAYVVATNASFGVNYGQPENYPLWGAMYDALGEIGVLSAAATMNINANVDVVGDIPTSFPSPYLISVTNTTRTDQKSTGAAYGQNTIDLGAPGTQIISTVPGNTYSSMSGTSMSAPHVAGAIGLMYAAASEELLEYYEEYPDALALIFKDIILESVDVIPALENITVSGGRLNVFNALQMVLALNESNLTPAPYNLTAEYTGENVNLSWEVHQFRIPQYFLIYRNGEIIAFAEADSNEYTDTSIASGWTYTYCVVAGYTDPPGDSEPSNPAVVNIPPSIPTLVYPEYGSESVEIDPLIQWEEVYGVDWYVLEIAYDVDFVEYVTGPVDVDEPFYQINHLEFETIYYWRVAAINEGGNSGWSHTYYFTTGATNVSGDEVTGVRTELREIFPNPFNINKVARNQGLQINFALETASHTTIRVFNIRGQLIRTLLSEALPPGDHTCFWDGKDASGQDMSSGIYMINMSGSEVRKYSKILLIK